MLIVMDDDVPVEKTRGLSAKTVTMSVSNTREYDFTAETLADAIQFPRKDVESAKKQR